MSDLPPQPGMTDPQGPVQNGQLPEDEGQYGHYGHPTEDDGQFAPNDQFLDDEQLQDQQAQYLVQQYEEMFYQRYQQYRLEQQHQGRQPAAYLQWLHQDMYGHQNQISNNEDWNQDAMDSMEVIAASSHGSSSEASIASWNATNTIHGGMTTDQHNGLGSGANGAFGNQYAETVDITNPGADIDDNGNNINAVAAAEREATREDERAAAFTAVALAFSPDHHPRRP